MSLIGPETNLYGVKERVGMRSLADVGEIKTVVNSESEKLASDVVRELACDIPLELDYGGDVEGLLFTFQPIK